MNNLLRMNLYRMKHTKLAYLLAGVGVGLSLLIYFVNYLVDRLMGAFNDLGIPPEAINGGTGQTHNVWDVVMAQSATSAAGILTVMFALLFINGDHSGGYIKNLVGYFNSKPGLCAANALPPALFGGVLTLLTTVLGVAFALIFYDPVDFAHTGRFLLYLLVTYLEILGYMMLLLFWADKTGKNILVMIVGVIYLFYKELVYQLIGLLIGEIFDKSVTVGRYTLLGGSSALSLDSPLGDYLQLGLIAAGVLALAFVLDVWALKRREYK